MFARKGRQEAKGGAAHGCAMSLIKIDARLLGTSLHAESGLHMIAALPSEDPNEFHKSSPRGFLFKNTSIQESEGPVLLVVLQLGDFCLSQPFGSSSIASLWLRGSLREAGSTVILSDCAAARAFPRAGVRGVQGK